MRQTSPTLLHILRQRAINTPNATAIIHEPREGSTSVISYLDLWRRSNGVAAQLGGTTKARDRVVLLFPSGPEFAVAFLGCLLARRIAVPAAVPRNERALERTVAIVRDSGARVVLTTGSMMLNLEASFSTLALDEDAAPLIVAVDQGVSAAERDQIDCQPGDVAFLQYTSGSTRHPRGVVVGHDNLMDNLRRSRSPFEFDNSDATMVSWLPAYHDMGLIGGLLAPFYVGCKTVLMSPSEFIQRPIKWLKLITKHKGTISGGPNFAYDACITRISERNLASLDLSSWRVAFNGSEPVRARTMDRFASKFSGCGFDARAVFPCYGLAEATLMVSGRGTDEYSSITLDRDALKGGRVLLSGADAGRTLVGCGRPNEGHAVAIVDPNTKRRCAETGIGEIWISGPSVCRGYWNRDGDTQDTFQAELEGVAGTRFLRTGDLGMLHNGQLYVSGRLKNIVIIRGLNYTCEDIEDVAQASHPAVAGAPGAAFGVDGPSGEELVIAQEINPKHLDDSCRAEVVAAIQESIVMHNGIRARDVILVRPRTLPRTTSGKLQRHNARALYAATKLALVEDDERSEPPRVNRAESGR